jgi:hypothetical protein
VYGDGTVIAATDDEWRVGTVSDLEIRPSAWIDCTLDECLVVDSQRDEFSRPVLPHEDPDDLVDP